MDNIIQSSNAQNIFKSVIKIDNNETNNYIEDVEIIENKLEQLKNLFPQASQKQLQDALTILESNIKLK